MSAARVITNRLMPDCSSFAGTMMISAYIEIIVSVILMICLVAAVLYNYLYKRGDATAEVATAKRKLINSALLTSMVFSLISVFIGVWHIATSNRLKSCVENNA